jgi:hypothetical protein
LYLKDSPCIFVHLHVEYNHCYIFMQRLLCSWEQLVTLVLLWRWKKIPETCIVLGAAVIGLVVYSLLHH